MPVIVSVVQGAKDGVKYDYITHKLTTIDGHVIAEIFEEEGMSAVFLGENSRLLLGHKQTSKSENDETDFPRFWKVDGGIILFKKGHSNLFTLSPAKCDFAIMFLFAHLRKTVSREVAYLSKSIFQVEKSVLVPRFVVGEVDEKVSDTMCTNKARGKGADFLSECRHLRRSKRKIPVKRRDDFLEGCRPKF